MTPWNDQNSPATTSAHRHIRALLRHVDKLLACRTSVGRGVSRICWRITGRACFLIADRHHGSDRCGDLQRVMASAAKRRSRQWSTIGVVGVIRSVVFDVGECLVNETREYETWADWLGVPRHTFSAVFGAVIARGLDYRETFQVFRPGFDLDEERRRRADAGQPEWFGEDDLYPDVRPVLGELHDAGLWLGLAGNQPVTASKILRELDLPVDMVATSDDWGLSKPSPGFFSRLVDELPCPASQTLYVGDRLDNDIRPASQAGMKTALIRRGPWGIIQEHDLDADRVATVRIRTLRDLPAKLSELNARAR
jgi:HAD superfamily hydrolase (TIGR01662 family)